ncbi:MAG: IPT/TIG domain-containing protein [Planctomycetota bacterium]
MKKNSGKILGVLVAATLAALIAGPGLVQAYNLLGGSLGVSTSNNGYQRDFRVFNNFEDGTANDNTVYDASFPDGYGAVQAIWKAGFAWASSNPNAAKNFDFDFQGATGGAGTINSNVCAGRPSGDTCSGGVLAYMQGPISNGWTIKFCENWVWSDGPGSPGTLMDLEGIGAHELGHALGLDHTQSGNCTGSCNSQSTMCPSVCNRGEEERTIQPDDASGLQAIYGSISAGKPTITSIEGNITPGGTITLVGSGFDSTVNVKFTADTSININMPGVVFGASSTSGGTRVAVTVPAEAQSGNVLVWEPSSRLSNPFPIDFSPPGPPVINNLSPSSVTLFQGGVVTISGSELLQVSQVDVGGTTLVPGQFSVVDDSTITFAAPQGTAFGSVNVTCTNNLGTSNASPLTYTETDPPKLSQPGQTWTNANFNQSWGGGSGHAYFLLLNLTGQTFNFQGNQVLSGFVITASGFLDPLGLGGTSITMPSGFGGLKFYSQIVTGETISGGVIWRASAVKSTDILF